MSFLYYADRVAQLPLGVVGAAIGTAMLPLLSKQIRLGQPLSAHRTQNRALEVALALSLPAAAALAVAAVPIIAALFERGAFGAEATAAAAAALAAYAAGPAGLRAGEGAGAGLLRARGSGHAGEDRAGHGRR